MGQWGSIGGFRTEEGRARTPERDRGSANTALPSKLNFERRHVWCGGKQQGTTRMGMDPMPERRRRKGTGSCSWKSYSWLMKNRPEVFNLVPELRGARIVCRTVSHTQAVSELPGGLPTVNRSPTASCTHTPASQNAHSGTVFTRAALKGTDPVACT